MDIYNNNVPGRDRMGELDNKQRRSRHDNVNRKKQPRFGICFDVDGVLARGTIPLPQTVKMIDLLKNDAGDVQVPITFVTNALNRNQDKASQIAGWLGVPISEEQMIQAQGPLEIFKEVHDKFCLVVGQGKIMDIAKECGFTNTCTVEEIADAYPLLDMVDHDNRRRVALQGFQEKVFPRVEAVVLMGEPKRWESALQILVDLLKTDGKPDHAPSTFPANHIPVIACNMDLQFMDRATMPRYGHGAFLLCLEALYKKCTGHELQYTSLVGKPSEVTWRYTEHLVTKQARKLGIEGPIERIYVVGDTPEADIVGANLYQRYVDRLQKRRNNIDAWDESSDPELIDPELPASRNVPLGCELYPQTVSRVESILVCTGVYKPGDQPPKEGEERNYRGHKDFPFTPALYKPTKTYSDVLEAVTYVLEKEGLAS